MAKGNHSHRGGGWHHSYANVYDTERRGYSPQFLETADWQRLNALRYQQQQAQEAARNAQVAVHFFPSVGKFIIPEENTWAAHEALVKDKATGLSFNPEKFVYFDKIIAEKFPAISEPKFAGLRNNLAVMRNDIIGIYLNDGSFDPGDEVHVPQIAGIAEALGEALANDTWLKRPFTRFLDSGVANAEGVGAAEMYQYLLERQEKPGLFEPLASSLKTLLSIPRHNWDLPPIEKTPFSLEGLTAPPPPARTCFTESELEQACGHPPVSFADRYANDRGTVRRLNP